MISGDYQHISEAQAMNQPHADAWRDESIPGQQLELTDKELEEWNRGYPIRPFDALKRCMQSLWMTGQVGTVLEVGCGVGHNADVMAAAGHFTYTGVDYSEAFINVAKARRAGIEFRVMDALLLDYQDKQFDCVVSGCVILHIVDWRTALKETARVARHFVVLHRTPLSDGDTQYYFKKAYGVQCVEIAFSEAELLAEMASLDYKLRGQYPVSEKNVTYLLERNQ